MRLSFPHVAGAVLIGVISGNVIFGPPLQKYWAEKQQQEAAKEGQVQPNKGLQFSLSQFC